MNQHFWVLIALGCLFLSACSHSAVRYEFYRAEIKYLHEEGNRKYQKGEYEKAIEHYETIIGYVPDHAEAYASLGNASLALSKTKAALGHYQKAIELKPTLKAELENYMAYGLTLPAKEKNSSYADFVKAVKSIDKEGVGLYQKFSSSITDPIKWSDNQRKLFRESAEEPSKLLKAAFHRGDFNTCKPCLVLTAAWFSNVLEPDTYPIITVLLEKQRTTDIAVKLAYRLGLAYERAGDRVAAVNTYLRYPNDPVIRGRLRR